MLHCGHAVSLRAAARFLASRQPSNLPMSAFGRFPFQTCRASIMYTYFQCGQGVTKLMALPKPVIPLPTKRPSSADLPSASSRSSTRWSSTTGSGPHSSRRRGCVGSDRDVTRDGFWRAHATGLKVGLAASASGPHARANHACSGSSGRRQSRAQTEGYAVRPRTELCITR